MPRDRPIDSAQDVAQVQRAVEEAFCLPQPEILSHVLLRRCAADEDWQGYL